MFRKNDHSPRFKLPPHLWRLRPVQLIVIDLGDWLMGFVGINLLWVIASLTVILLPPATAALFESAQRAFQNQPPTTGQFFVSMRRWFVLSWLIALANLLILGGLFLLGRLVYPNEIPLAMLAVATGCFVWVQFFFWPFLLLQTRPSPFQALRNSAFTIMSDLPYFTGYLALTVLMAIPSVIVIAPMLFITPVLFALINTYSLNVWLQNQGILDTEIRDT
ncbi:MAG: DUF624 domain-containing protein [Anaerolineae bacterium]|nr:DUF624 domain-containing protein [Anaerolineae bacterium]